MNNFDHLWANNKLRLVVTEECNLACFYCHNEGQPKGLAYLSEPLFQQVLELITSGEDTITSITFTGGEPLLHPRLEYFISQLSSKCIGCQDRTVVTNGWLLTPARLQTLIDSGITKVRLGVDSLSRESSRPSPHSKPQTPIVETVHMLKDSRVEVELNIVLTHYNSSEVSDLVTFCRQNQISAKFFEHVEVREHGNANRLGNMVAEPLITFDQFHESVMKTDASLEIKTVAGFDEANIQYEGVGYNLRYCRYLCPYKLCFTTGTRIDPAGNVYTCMKQRGRYQITSVQSISESIEIARSAVRLGCG